MTLATKKKVTERYYGTGRRKKSIARVYLMPGSGEITINKRSIDDYFGPETLKTIVRQPLVATGTADKYDVLVNVQGGGYTGQAGAIRHGISRALLEVDSEHRPTLRKRASLPGIPEGRRERSTVSKPHVALLSSQNVDRYQKRYKHPGIQKFRGVFVWRLQDTGRLCLEMDNALII